MRILSRRYVHWPRLLVGLIIAGGPAAGLGAQEPAAFVRIVPGNRVQLLDAGGRTVREVYRSPAMHTSAVELEPDGGRVALLEWNETSGSLTSELVVLHQSGRVESRPARDVQGGQDAKDWPTLRFVNNAIREFFYALER